MTQAQTTTDEHANAQFGQSPSGERAREWLVAEMPVTERRLQLAGIPTAVLEGGDGPPVVLLHGPGEHATKWLRVIPSLTTTHRVIAPDLPGHGISPETDGSLDADRVLAWLSELIEQTCPTLPVLVGQILGGAIAARLATTQGDRLKALVLADAFGKDHAGGLDIVSRAQLVAEGEPVRLSNA